MKRRRPPHLHDEFPQVTFIDFHPGLFFQIMIEINFLGDHGFALGDHFYLMFYHQILDDGTGLSSISGPQDFHAVGHSISLEFLQEFRQIFHCIFPDGFRLFLGQTVILQLPQRIGCQHIENRSHLGHKFDLIPFDHFFFHDFYVILRISSHAPTPPFRFRARNETRCIACRSG